MLGTEELIPRPAAGRGARGPGPGRPLHDHPLARRSSWTARLRRAQRPRLPRPRGAGRRPRPSYAYNVGRRCRHTTPSWSWWTRAAATAARHAPSGLAGPLAALTRHVHLVVVPGRPMPGRRAVEHARTAARPGVRQLPARRGRPGCSPTCPPSSSRRRPRSARRPSRRRRALRRIAADRVPAGRGVPGAVPRGAGGVRGAARACRRHRHRTGAGRARPGRRAGRRWRGPAPRSAS